MAEPGVVGPLDRSLISHLPGEWRIGEPGMVACGACGEVRPAEVDRGVARTHWESHVVAPSVATGYEVIWYVHPAGEDGKHVARGAVGAFVAMTMASYLRPDLPAPRRGVVQEFVDQGERLEGMGAGFDWPRFEVTDEIYEVVAGDLIAAGAASTGSDPEWADSLFFRHAERLAAERGTDIHHEIRRVTIMNESAAIRSRFPDLDEAVLSALRRRSSQANEYDFDQPLESLL